MATDPLARLDHEAERWLFAGLAALASDPARPALREALAPLAARVPAVAAASALLERAATEPEALLGLAALATQLRGARASLRAVEGPLGELDAVNAVLAPPCDPERVRELAAALSAALTSQHDPYTGAPRTVDAALAFDACAGDLRLFPLWCALLDARDEGAAVAATDALLRYRASPAPALHRRFDLPGSRADAAWLACVAPLARHVPALDRVLQRALDHGGPEVATVALAHLAERDPPRALAAARSIAASARPVALRARALATLAAHGDDGALEQLVAAFEQDSALGPALVPLFVSLPERFDAALIEALALQAKRYTEGSAALDAEERALGQGAPSSGLAARVDAVRAAALEASRARRVRIERARNAAAACFAALCEALAQRGGACLDAVRARFSEASAPDPLRASAGRALRSRGDATDLARLRDALDDASYSVRELALDAHFAAAPAEAFERLAPRLRDDDPLAPQLALRIAERRSGAALDPRWQGPLEAALAAPALAEDAAAALAAARFEAAASRVYALAEATVRGAPERFAEGLLESLVALRAEGSAALLVGLLDGPACRAQPHRRAKVYALLRALGDARAVGPLRARGKRFAHDRTELARIEETLRALEPPRS